MEQMEFGSSQAGKKGGRARADRLTPEQRSAIAREASRARWDKAGKGLPCATHEGILHIVDTEIPCAVLSDGSRVLSRIQFIKAIGRKGKPKGGRRYDDEFKRPVFLTAENLTPFISSELLENSSPFPYRSLNGLEVIGYRAELLPGVCGVFIDADEAGVLRLNQKHIAAQCRILMRGLATVGVVGLVDEATGFQASRASDALAKILQAFVAKELRKWVRTFRADYFEQLCRLREWPFKENYQLPRYAGKLTDDLVYKRLAPGVRDELRRLNPADKSGRRKSKHHQWLTEEFGHPKLQQHLAAVTALMRGSDDWESFQVMLDRALPRQPDMPIFPNMDDDVV